MNKLICLMLLSLVFVKIHEYQRKRELGSYYYSEILSIKERLINGSKVDTKKDLEDHEDRIVLYMHLDGFNGKEVLDMKVKALHEVFGTKNKDDIRG